MDVEASRAIRQAEVGASQTMIERTEASFGIKPEWLAADTAYGSAANLDWLVNQQGIAPHVPVIDKSQRDDGTFNREDFTFDKERNVYICPAGKISRRRADWSTMGRRHCFTSRACSTVVAVHSGRDAVRRCLLGGSHAVSTRRPGTLLVGWPRQRHSSNHAAIARRSRCCSHTSSAFCGLADCAFAVPPARSSSSRWRRLHRTSAGSQSWSHDLRRSREPRVLRESLHGIRGFLLEFALLRTEQDDTRRRSQDLSWPATGITGDFYNKIDP